MPDYIQRAEFEATMRDLFGQLEVINGDLYNHGKDGLKTQFTSFISEFRTVEAIRKDEEAKRQKAEDRRWALVAFIVALLTLFCAVLSIPQISRILKGDMSQNSSAVTAYDTTTHYTEGN
jgi:hypothetical protein